jgi:eukaryotic-like serine/threonine-protein kinase
MPEPSDEAVKTLFLQAADLDPARRGAFLDERCAGDADLRAAVEELLRFDAKAQDSPDFMHSPAADVRAALRMPPEGVTASFGTYQPAAGAPTTAAHDPGLPDYSEAAATDFHPLAQGGVTIAGRYTLVEKIGEGGMGEVWVAKQTTPVKRGVAVKFIKPGMDSRSVLARFEAERQALAVMDHPNIAKVLDGGLTADGKPYFVMELVKGVPITQYCDAARLTPRQRLELFVPVCQAIQHAHQKGIIHRDIKPSNVLIAVYDDKPVPKVIDFGIAKATGQPLTDETLNTVQHGIVGTPQYMSPEQATLNNLDIDTRTDVYSLGVLLYELLTGAPPFSGPELLKRGKFEILRVVREEDPPRPSSKLGADKTLAELAARRATEPKKLTALLRSELDWIILRALEKDRARRYESSNGLAADIHRLLAGEPVLAHPPGGFYRLKKFLGKHKGPVGAAATILTVAVAGLLAVAIVQAEGSRRLAAKNFELEQANTRVALARDRAEARVDLALGAVASFRSTVDGNLDVKNRPENEALRKTLLQAPLAFYQKLRDDLKASVDDVPENRAKLADAYLRLAGLDRDIGSQADALKACNEAVELLDQLSRDDATPHRDVLLLQLARALNDRGELESVSSSLSSAALESFGQAREILQAHMGERDVASRLELARTLRDVAKAEAKRGDVDSALATLRKSLSVLEEANRMDPDHVGAALQRADAHLQISVVLHEQRSQIPEALAATESALRIVEPLARARPGDADCHLKLAEVYEASGSLHESRSEVDKALSDYNKRLAVVDALVAANPTVTNYRYHRVLALCDVASTESDLGQNDAALATLKTARDLAASLVRDNPANVRYKKALGKTWNLAAVPQYALGKIPDAVASIEAYAAVLAEANRADPDDLTTLRSINAAHYNCGLLNVSLGRTDKGLASYDQSRQLLERLTREHPDDTGFAFNLASTLGNVGVVHRNQHRYRDAAESFRQAIETLKKLSAAHPENAEFQSYLIRAQRNLGDVLTDLGQTSEAVAVLRSALDATERMAKEHSDVVQYQEDRVEGLNYLTAALGKAGQVDEALATCKKGIGFCEGLLKSNPEKRANSSRLAELLREQGSLLQESGQPGEAVRSYQRAIALLEGIPSPSVTYLGELARCHARLAGLAAVAGSGLPAEAARTEAEKAIEAIRRALAADFAVADLPLTNSDFDLVRTREDFQKLLRDIEAKAKSKAAK